MSNECGGTSGWHAAHFPAGSFSYAYIRVGCWEVHDEECLVLATCFHLIDADRIVRMHDVVRQLAEAERPASVAQIEPAWAEGFDVAQGAARAIIDLEEALR